MQRNVYSGIKVFILQCLAVEYGSQFTEFRQHLMVGYSLQTRWRVTLRFSEHRRELAREACLRPSAVEYDPLFVVDTMQQIRA